MDSAKALPIVRVELIESKSGSPAGTSSSWSPPHGAVLLRPDRTDELHWLGSLGRWRQWIESTFDTLKDQLGLERHGGRTLGGVVVRVGQRLLALAAAIWWNWTIGGPDKRSLVAYDR